jgi:transposase
LEKRRRKAIALLKAGRTFQEVAAVVHASVSSLVRWQQAYRRDGPAGLSSKPNHGRPSLLSPREKQRLEKILLQGPLGLGYRTDLWTLKRVAQVVEERFGVRYSLPGLWKLMASLGWSCQKPETRARERDEKAIAHWKRYVWPQIKKSRKTWRPSRLP